MQDQFATYIGKQTNLSKEEIDRILEAALRRSLSRNEDFLRAGDISRHKVFVLSGMLRTYSVSDDGREHILQFSPENTWTLDVESYDKQVPARVSIGAIERSEILYWQRSDFNNLLASIPGFKTFSEQLISRSTWYNRQRMLTVLGGSPEERYDDFIKTFPQYLARLPLRMIAAYLGISLKTLTRIRHAQTKRS